MNNGNKGMLKNIIIIFVLLIIAHIDIHICDYFMKNLWAHYASIVAMGFYIFCGIAIKLFDYSRKSNLAVLLAFFIYVALGTFGIVPRIFFVNILYRTGFAYFVILGAVLYEFVKLLRTNKHKE